VLGGLLRHAGAVRRSGRDVVKLDRKWLGMAGVPAHDSARAYAWERRLHGVMLGFALLSIAAFSFVGLENLPQVRRAGYALEWAVFIAFALELLWMLLVIRQKLRYLLGNWLDVLIVVAAGLSIAGHDAKWVVWARLLRAALVGMMLARALAGIRILFAPGGLPYIFGFAVIAMLAAGAGFYWLDPSIRSYGDGLWLAFVTPATVGYGDLVPTTPAARLLAVIIVVIGVALLSVVTASIAAFLVGEDEKLLRREMHHDVRQLRQEVAAMLGEEERAVRAEVRDDVRMLREEIGRLRDELRRGRDPARGGESAQR
jgi:voltage-gated potassium channel